MRDLLGRELKDGDMCISMAIGRHSSGMHLGIFQGSSVVCLSYNEERTCKSCTSNTYLIENPTEKELAVKDKIQKLIDKETEERERKAKLKTIPLSKLEVGGIYKTTRGQYCMYLGKRKVTFECDERKLQDKQEGHCFVFVYSFENQSDEKIVDELLSIYTYRDKHNIDVLKGNKKLTEMVRKVDLTFPLIKEEDEYINRYRQENFKLTVE
jgi:hypothetical protein